MTWYRIQDASRDPQALLDPASWVSRTWSPQQVTCAACDGRGITGHPECGDECETCGGNGYHDEAPRSGVSVMRTLHELAAYAEGTAMDLRDTVVVALDGEMSGDEDQDARAGAYLVLPSAIVSVTPAGEVAELAEHLARDEVTR